MESRTLGLSDIAVSVVGLGCNSFGSMDQAVADAVVGRALDLGVTLFDTADVYGRGLSEMRLAKALGPRRKDVIIATKFGNPMDDERLKAGAAARYVREACDASLKRLGTDWIDLYQLHRPDPATPMDETMGALAGLVVAGKVRMIGCSNLPASTLSDANMVAREAGEARFECAQDSYSLLDRRLEQELLPALQSEGMGLLPYLPLAGGMLTGKYVRGETPAADTRMGRFKFAADAYMTDSVWDRVEQLAEFAQRQGHTLLELAMSWLAARPQVASVIAGATKPSQVTANVGAATWSLSSEETREVDCVTAPG